MKRTILERAAPPVGQEVRAVSGPGGVVRLNAGGEPIHLSAFTRNTLVKVEPTLVVEPYSWEGTQKFTTVIVASGATHAVSTDMASPVTSSPIVKLVGGVGEGENSVTWVNAVDIEAAPDDVWIVAVWVDRVVANVKLRMTNGSVFSDPATHRTFTWLNDRVRFGWNFLVCGHGNEDFVGENEYGRVGNNLWGAWEEAGSVNATSRVRSIRVGVTNISNSTAYIGGVWRAPRGWCTSALMLGADDVPRSYYDLAIPELERRGLPHTLNITTAWTNRAEMMGVAEIRRCRERGAEIFAHTQTHPNMTSISLAEAEFQLRSSREFCLSNGIEDGALGMAWPFNSSNHDTEMAARAAGFKLARGYRGRYLNSWQPGHRAFHLPSISGERENSWHTDTEIKRCWDYGLAGILYLHGTVAGGSGIDVRPADSRHYFDHLVRWLDQIEGYVSAGEMIVTDIQGYFGACGIDIRNTPLIEKI